MSGPYVTGQQQHDATVAMILLLGAFRRFDSDRTDENHGELCRQMVIAIKEHQITPVEIAALKDLTIYLRVAP